MVFEEAQRCGSQHGDLKPEVVGAHRFGQISPTTFFMCGKRVLLRMEICEELRYNFGAGRER